MSTNTRRGMRVEQTVHANGITYPFCTEVKDHDEILAAISTLAADCKEQFEGSNWIITVKVFL